MAAAGHAAQHVDRRRVQGGEVVAEEGDRGRGVISGGGGVGGGGGGGLSRSADLVCYLKSTELIVIRSVWETGRDHTLMSGKTHDRTKTD